MTDLDLFPEDPAPSIGPKKRRRLKYTIGYAGQPGQGPAGETCGTCHYKIRRDHNTRAYNKCGHMRGHISRSEASDILVSAPACQFWAKRDPQTAPRAR